MPFDTDLPPPPSKYSYAELRLDGLDLNDDYSDDDDDNTWMYSSSVDNESTPQTLQSIPKISTNFVKRFSAQKWLEKIEEKYFEERDDLVRQCIQAALQNVDDPYSFVLHVIHCGFFDLYSKRVPIHFYAMDELEMWLDLKKNDGEEIPPVYHSHKCQAGEFVCHKGYNYLDKMNKLYQLDQGDNAFLADYVQLDNLKSKKLKETVTIIYTLKLQHCFAAEDVVLPLIANDQFQVLETYIDEDKQLQHGYLDYLNTLCGMEEYEIKQMVSMKGLSVKDFSKLRHKTITKIAEKAVKRYNLNPDNYQKVFEAKNIHALYHLVKMKQREKHTHATSPYCDKWDHLLETAVSDKRWLQILLIQKFHELDELYDAVSWSVKLNVHPNDLPSEVAETLQNYAIKNEFKIPPLEEFHQERQQQQEQLSIAKHFERVNAYDSEQVLFQSEEDWETEIESSAPRPIFSYATGFVNNPSELRDTYYQLSIPVENVKIIDSIEKLQKLTDTLFTDGQIIGFDAEWKPKICKAGEKDRISILQLAAKDFVFILDLLHLYVLHGAERPLEKFFFNFFTSRNVIKVGYGIAGDLKLLMGMFSCTKDYILKTVNLVDLCEVSPKITTHPAASPYLFSMDTTYMPPDTKGLSRLVLQVLGKRLDKTFQISDWERRPLLKEQVHYAALDAYCLLEVYSIFQNIVKDANVRVNLKENVKLKWLKRAETISNQRKDKYNKQSCKEKVPVNMTPLFKGPPRPLASLQIICDTMLQGLGKQLRLCGVDTFILENHQDHSTAIQISHKEDRIILTRGKPYFMMYKYVREGMCMWVPEGNVKEQIKMVFTRYNVALQTKDIMSRCTICNSPNYILVPPVDMELAFNLKYELHDAEMPDTQTTQSRLINLSNYTLTNNGVEIQLDFIPIKSLEKDISELFQRVDIFYVCEKCGKVYWIGSHHKATKDEFKEFFDKREIDKSYYATPR